MTDPLAEISDVDTETQEQLVDLLDRRSSDEQVLAMAESYISSIPFDEDAEVVEIGCGTGGVTKFLAARPRVGRAVGVDASPVFLERARDRNSGLDDIAFRRGDARSLPFDDASVDVTVYHTSLCHLPGPVASLEEAFRVLRPGGTLAVFDGDYASMSVALGPHDPIQKCVDKFSDELINNPWLMRRIPTLMRDVGFTEPETDTHGYLADDHPRYLLSMIHRGADYLAEVGQLSSTAAEDMKREVDRRVEEDRFFGFLPFLSALATKPED